MPATEERWSFHVRYISFIGKQLKVRQLAPQLPS
jgi:hypothetical protein